MTAQDTRPPRHSAVCFVALRAYGLLSGDPRAPHIGGAEVQQCLLARGLSLRGHASSMVTLDVGQEDALVHDGVVAFRSYREGSGIPGVRFFWPRITSVWAAMRRADASVYYQRTSDSLTGVVAAFCKRRGRLFLFSVGEDSDCLPSLPNCRTARERALYRYGLRRADAVVAQTRWQREALARNFGVKSHLIRSAARDPGEPAGMARAERPRLLWAGRLAPQKRPELLIEVARRCPEIDFDMVGARSSGAPGAEIAAAAAGVSILRLHGFVAHGQVSGFYERARALVCTSAREGFPNTFLEAWSRGRPVLTTLDPDDVVATERIGLIAADADGLAAAARRLTECHEEWDAMSRRARHYYLREHRPERILDDYESLLGTLSAHEAETCSR
jgi:glycosyltransferase involved in cell wall biosynthesis